MMTMRFLMCTIIRCYQLCLGPWFGGRCRFFPSCSEYALRVHEHLPLWKALRLTGTRLLRCHPFGAFGADPPPRNEVL